MEQNEFTRAYQASCLKKLSDSLANSSADRVDEAVAMINDKIIDIYELKDLLTIQEVASHMRMGEETVRRWIKAGKLKALKAGRTYRIRKLDLIDFVSGKQGDQ